MKDKEARSRGGGGGGRSGRRAASERALLQAFEAMLQRQGASKVGVNAVLGSAKVGKRLLYKYFGDLQGLAANWARDRRDPLELGRREAALKARLLELPPGQRLTAALRDYATSLRAHPWALQVLLAELSPPEALGDALHAMRLEIGSGYERVMTEVGAFSGPGAMQRALVLQAAATYLALRSHFAPDYNGLDLRSGAGWRAAMKMLDGSDGGGVHPAASNRKPVARRRGAPSAPRRAPVARRRRPG